jgi:serine/threonine protein kinase
MDQHDLETGVQIGDFQIESRLGAGGMGIVYRARQVSLDRVVALKILGSALTRETDLARFRREARLIAKLDHPSIAGVHFIGQDRHVCYMAREFIDGIPLRALLDRLTTSRDTGLTIEFVLRESHAGGKEAPELRFDHPTKTYAAGNNTSGDAEGVPADSSLPTDGARRLSASRPYIRWCCEGVREAALALGHAHEPGVVHRDVKPENLLVDRQGRVHLIDFGVARFFEDVSLTNTGALVGTPMYMSPEQVMGRLELDHRTDVYSLGLVLYELLCLGRPIAATTREGVLRQIVTKAIAPVSSRNSAVPRDLEGVLHKAIARDPDDRYQSTAEFAADLLRWLDGKPVTALPYRYRFDRREIKAERPPGILVLGFAHFLIAALSTLGILSATAWLLVGVGTAAQSREVLGSGLWYFLAASLLAFTYSLAVGFGLLAAHRWARWITIVACSLLAAWCLYGIVTERTLQALGSQAVFVAPPAAMIAYLMRRSTRDWFRLAARLRAEHKHAR